MNYRFKYPSQIGLEITNRCNFNCKHCINDSNNISNVELPLSKIKEIIDYMHSKGLVCLDISGGEPLVHPDIKEIIEYAYNNNMNLSVASNGYLVNSEIIELFKRCKVNLRISFDGYNEDTYSIIRGKHKFEIVKKNIKLAVKENVPVTLVTVLHQNNFDYLEKIIVEAKKLGVEKLRLMPYVTVGRGLDSDLKMLLPEQWKYIVQNHKYLGQKFNLEIVIDSPLMAISEEKHCPCLVGKLCLTIKSNGDAIPCALMDIKVGNIYEQTIEEIWKNNIFDDINDVNLLKGECKECKYKKDCAGGCRGMAYILKGDYLCKDPYCWLKSQNR